MKDHPMRFWGIVSALLLGLGVAEQTLLPSVDDMMRNARSEIRSEDLPSWLDGVDLRGSDEPPLGATPTRRTSDD